VPASFRGPNEVLPEYYLYDLALCRSARAIVYLLLRAFVYVVVRVLPNILGLVVDGILEVILVVGVVR
jgi:hypothetical protein